MTKWEKGAVPEGEMLSALYSEQTLVMSYSAGLPHLFLLPSLMKSIFMGCYKIVVFSCTSLFIYSIRRVTQDGKTQSPCPREPDPPFLLRAFKSTNIGSSGQQRNEQHHLLTEHHKEQVTG